MVTLKLSGYCVLVQHAEDCLGKGGAWRLESFVLRQFAASSLGSTRLGRHDGMYTPNIASLFSIFQSIILVLPIVRAYKPRNAVSSIPDHVHLSSGIGQTPGLPYLFPFFPSCNFPYALLDLLSFHLLHSPVAINLLRSICHPSPDPKKLKSTLQRLDWQERGANDLR